MAHTEPNPSQPARTAPFTHVNALHHTLEHRYNYPYAQSELHPHDLPHVRTAFGEWRRTGNIVPQD